MTDQRTSALAQALSVRPIPLTTDVDDVSDFVWPRKPGQTAAEHTDELLAESLIDNPTRRRQCSIGQHGECSDGNGTDGCGCACHALLKAMREDHPYLDSLTREYENISWFGSKPYDGWWLAYTLLDLGYTFDETATAPHLTDDDAAQLADQIWGEHGDEEHDIAAGVLETLTEQGLLRRTAPPAE